MIVDRTCIRDGYRDEYCSRCVPFPFAKATASQSMVNPPPSPTLTPTRTWIAPWSPQGDRPGLAWRNGPNLARTMSAAAPKSSGQALYGPEYDGTTIQATVYGKALTRPIRLTSGHSIIKYACNIVSRTESPNTSPSHSSASRNSSSKISAKYTRSVSNEPCIKYGDSRSSRGPTRCLLRYPNKFAARQSKTT